MAFRRAGRGAKMPVRRRAGAKKGVPTVASLARQVKALKRESQIALEFQQYANGGATDLTTDPAVINLNNFTSWTHLWPTVNTATHNTRSKMYWLGFKFDFNVTLDNINNEEGEIQFTAFIVSTKDAAGSTLITTPLTNNVDYTMTGGMAMMNPKKFKVHWQRRFTLTGGDGPDMQADRCLYRSGGYIKVRKMIEATDDDWRGLSNSPDPSDNYYFIVLSNNDSADLENPRLTYHFVNDTRA